MLFALRNLKFRSTIKGSAIRLKAPYHSESDKLEEEKYGDGQ